MSCFVKLLLTMENNIDVINRNLKYSRHFALYVLKIHIVIFLHKNLYAVWRSIHCHFYNFQEKIIIFEHFTAVWLSVIFQTKNNWDQCFSVKFINLINWCSLEIQCKFLKTIYIYMYIFFFSLTQLLISHTKTIVNKIRLFIKTDYTLNFKAINNCLQNVLSYCKIISI